MPAIITHDTFGREAYDAMHALIGDSREECDAFLLGNQGPDAFFFGQANPLLLGAWGIGTAMHRANPNVLLSAYRDAVGQLPSDAQSVGRAYVLGMVCHYLLDSSAHPFIYAQQNAICSAGVDGLDAHDGHEVHAEIESDLDVMVLSVKTGKTIRDFDPSSKVLRGSAATLGIISQLSRDAATRALGRRIPDDAYMRSVEAWRVALRAMHSPTGIKRALLGKAEELIRRHSMVRAMSHRNQLMFVSAFGNDEHAEWVDPGTGDVRTESFWDIYDDALERAKSLLPRFFAMPVRELEAATRGLDFNGNPAAARILKVE